MRNLMFYSVHHNDKTRLDLKKYQAVELSNNIEKSNLGKGIDKFEGLKIEVHTPRGSFMASGINAWSDISSYLK